MYRRMTSWTACWLTRMLCVVCPKKGRGLRALPAACHIRLTEEEDKEGEKKKRKTRHMTKEEKEQIEEMTKILRQEILREEKESLWECDLTARFASTPPQAS